MKLLFKSNSLPIPNVAWHTIESEIDLSLQRDKLVPELLTDGFTIIPEVDFELLLNKMTVQDAAMLRKRDLYSPKFHDRTISTILNHWINNEKLIPPTILIYDEIFVNALNNGRHIITSEELRPIDGKHRLHVSYYFGVKTIPILVINKQLSSIKDILNIP